MFQYNFKIYYEDTDSGGVVYYANYLKFIERARTEIINELGFTLNSLLKDHDRLFLVKKIDIIFKAKILMVCVNSQGTPSKIPDDLQRLMKNKDG